MKQRSVFALLMFAFALTGPSALEFERISPSLGVIYIPRPEAYATQSGPSIMANTLGAGLSLPLSDGLAFEPSLSFYWTYHLWDTSLGRALPAEIENRTSFTLGFLLESPLFLRMRLGERLGLGFGLGPALHLRVGFAATGLTEAQKADLPSINGFFYEHGRFFMPESLLRFEWRLAEKVDLGLTFQAFWPISNWWSGSEWFWDEAIFGAQAGLRFRLH